MLMTSVSDVTPLLVGLAVRRTGDCIIPGRYDSEKRVWVVDGPEGCEPIVLTAHKSAELVTKTKVRQEQDDPSNIVFLDGATKTAAPLERDDVGIGSLLELATKTETRRERDD